MKSMKKLTYILSAALCGLALLPSCRKTDVVETPTFVLCTDGQVDNLIVYGEVKNHTEEVEYFEYASKAVAADSIYKAQRFHIYSNCDWKIVPLSDDQSWVTPFPEDGGSGEGLIFFRVKRNNDRSADRVAGYRFVLNDGMKDIEVGGTFLIHQTNAKPRLVANVNKVEVVSTGGNASVRVASNIAWTYTLVANADYASEDPALWTEDLTELKYEDEEKKVLSVNNTIKISCPDNSAGSIRGFNIIIKAVDESLGIEDVVIPVTQEGAAADIVGFPVSWKAASNDYPKWPSAANNPPTILPAEGSGSICFYRAEIPGLDRAASTCDVSGSNPRVNGAWPGDYYEFTADAPVPAGSLIKIQFEARVSGSGCRHWRLEYLDGNDWKIAGTLQTTKAPDGTEVRYTQDMYPGGSGDEYNKIISQVVKYENTTSEAKFRWYVASNIIASSGLQMEKPTTASARLDYSGSSTGSEPSISCVAAGGETLVYGNVTCSDEILLFEGTPAGPLSFTVTSDQDYTISSNSDWITLDVTSAAAYVESKVNVTCQPSAQSTLREGLITIVSGMTKKGIRVIQSAAGGQLDPLIAVVGGNSTTLLANSSTIDVKVQSNVDFLYSSDVDWITPAPQTKAMVEVKECPFEIAANTGLDDRIGHIRFYNEEYNIESILTVKQLSDHAKLPVRWTVRSSSNFASTWPVPTHTASVEGKSGYINATSGIGTIWFNNEYGVAADDDNKCLLDISDASPRVTGVWINDYCQFKVPGKVDAGRKVRISFETRVSKTNPKYWRLKYLDGAEWKDACETKTATVDGEGDVVYTHQMASDGKTNIKVDVTVTYGTNTDDIVFRFISVTTMQASGSGCLEKPNGGTWRLSVTNKADDDQWQPTIQFAD